ncbi:alpha-hydroxy acid oxidase [Thalassotalea sp. Y01]|uniref:alpha-hydroxy acid oxidase n=1 Tax=Thalassotalea sp. Y01 TaxID=2729613 RepID=UPI0020071D51|nr:alpha-hydroxy acid oxidase [Thalassotalea sp. Y01]
MTTLSLKKKSSSFELSTYSMNTPSTPVAGNRERDIVYGMTIPPRFTARSAISYMTSWHWGVNFLRDPEFIFANIAHRIKDFKTGTAGMINYINSQFDQTINWDDVSWLAEQWDGPIVIKGCQSGNDAKLAINSGASAMMISNHGGRQLDCSPAPIDCIKGIRDAVGEDLELIVDGGIRRGSDIVKALAAGANACSIGRPYLYGLAAGGQQGVELALSMLKSEVERTMALMGAKSIAQVDHDYLFKNN